jgi:hypothetical protein
MADLLADANAWLQGVRHDKATQDVRYQRGSEHLGLKATIGRTEFLSEAPSGARIVDEARDYLLRSADLDFGLGPIPPLVGDQIIETVGTQKFTYEVVPFGPLSEHWRYSDPFRVTLRVHTKLINTEIV